MDNPLIIAPLIIVIFLLFFSLMWSFIVFLTSRTGGWHTMSKHYSGELSYENERLNFRSGRFGLAKYSGVMTFAVNDEEMGLSVLFLYRMGHPPLKIPFEEISAVEKTVLFPEVHLTFAQVPNRTLKIRRALAEQLETASGGNWTFERKPKL